MNIQYFHKPDQPTGLLILDDDMYEVSRDAHQPNGVCIYVGPREDDPDRFRTLELYGEKADIPAGVVRQIVNIISQRPGDAAAEAEAERIGYRPH